MFGKTDTKAQRAPQAVEGEHLWRCPASCRIFLSPALCALVKIPARFPGLFRGGAGVRAEAVLLCPNGSRLQALEEGSLRENEPTCLTRAHTPPPLIPQPSGDRSTGLPSDVKTFDAPVLSKINLL